MIFSLEVLPLENTISRPIVISPQQSRLLTIVPLVRQCGLM